MNPPPCPILVSAFRLLLLSVVAGLLIGLAPVVVLAQARPSSQEWVRSNRLEEIERVASGLDGEDHKAEYLLYVVLPIFGLIGGLFILRRLL